MISVEELYNILKKAQEPKGYFFNKDKGKVSDLLSGLIINSQRYGYMSCPCRLASGDYAKDRDIICPCIYRSPDVAEFGSCYCSLYVSETWNNDKTSHSYVPERRPLDKMPF